MVDQREQQNFIITTADIGAVNAGVTVGVNLETIKNEYGNNFNTLLVTNNATEEFIIILNGREFSHVKGSGGQLSIDWRDGILFDNVRMKNNDGATNSSANEVRISVGRTGAGKVTV